MRFKYFAQSRRSVVASLLLADEQTAVASYDRTELANLAGEQQLVLMDLAEAKTFRDPKPPWPSYGIHDTLDQQDVFDSIIAINLVEIASDIPHVLFQIKRSLSADGRLVVLAFSRLWQPVVRFLTFLQLRKSRTIENWVPPSEVANFLELADFEVVTRSNHILIPFKIPLLSNFLNRWVAPLPVFRNLCCITAISARQRTVSLRKGEPTVSVVIAARNEAGNIETLLDRLPQLASRQEVILVEGGSEDDTWGVIERAISNRQLRNTDVSYLALRQPGKGKADAVRWGFAHSSGDILVILDADISVPPEEMRGFVDVLIRGHCRFANGSRLVYAMDKRAMRFLNLLGNRFFGTLFTFLIGQPVRDTLCGTKAMWRTDYERIVANRRYFGDFDPFGDFDLLFGAARLGIRIRDVPVHYKARTYGATNISRFRHGLLLLRMSWIAAKKLRFTEVA